MKHIETHGIHTKDLVLPYVSTCFQVFRFQTTDFHCFKMSATTYSKFGMTPISNDSEVRTAKREGLFLKNPSSFYFLPSAVHCNVI